MKPQSSPVREGLPGLLPRMWRFALVLSGNRDVAGDLVQAACARALEREAQFVPGTRLDHWTFTLIASIWKNQKRAQAVRHGNGLVDAAAALVAEAAQEVEAGILTQQVLTAVGRLPEAQRSAVLLVYVEGLSYRDAAAALDIPIGTLISRLAAAKQALGAALGDPLRSQTIKGGEE